MEERRGLENPNDLKSFTQPWRLIISYHDFRATKKLEQISWPRMSKFQADFYKLVSHGHQSPRQRGR